MLKCHLLSQARGHALPTTVAAAHLRYKTIISAPRRINGYLRCRRCARLTSLIGRGHTRSNRVCDRPIRRTVARRQAAAGTPLGRPAWRCSTRRTAASMSAPAAGASSGLAVLSRDSWAQPRPPMHWRRLCALIWSCCSPVSWSLTGRWIIHLHTA